MTTHSTEPAPLGASDQDLGPGTEVGEYRIDGVLGKGGFGTVYAAVQPVIGKQAAIKVLARKYSADPDIVSRFVAEARAVNQIRHRNIIDIFSFGQLPDGRHYYVMEYLDGDPLDAYLREHGPMSLDEAVPVLRAIARALDAAHAKGIAHRDLKPENIFLARDADGTVFPKLLDFGIAKLLTPDDDVRHRTNTGVPIGTPYYMSPEQCRGKDVDHRTDIYSFGIVAYRVLTGTLPFEGDDYMELLFKQTSEEAPPPSTRRPGLPATVDQAIAWMMRKDRAQRPPSVIEAVNALDPSVAVTPPLPSVSRSHHPTSPPRVITPGKSASAEALAATFTPQFERPEAPRPAARKPRLVIGGIVLVLAAAGVATFVTMRLRNPAAPTTPAAVPAVPADPADHADPAEPAAPPTQPAAATVPAQVPVDAGASVEPAPVEPAPVEPVAQPTEPVVEPKTPGTRTIKKPPPTTTVKPPPTQTPTPTDRDVNKSRDYEPLGSDAFK